MALLRAARSSIRRSAGSFGTCTSARLTFCEGILQPRHSTPMFENAGAGFNSSYISSMRMINEISFGNRGMKFTPQHQFAHAQAQVVEDPDLEHKSTRYAILEATKQGQKPRVVVLGSGWAACRFLNELDTTLYNVVCISPRNYMVLHHFLRLRVLECWNFDQLLNQLVRYRKHWQRSQIHTSF